MTRADRALLVVLVLLAVAAVPAAAWAARGQVVVRVSGPAGVTEIDPDHDGTYRVEGRISDVVFEMRGGSLRCIESGCPDQICVHAGSVRPGAPVVCAPNGVVAERVGGKTETGAFDAISR